MDLTNTIDKCDAIINFGVNLECCKIIEENYHIICDMVIDQMSKGISGDGTQSTTLKSFIRKNRHGNQVVSSGYSTIYERATIKLKLGKPGLAGETEFITNYGTGELYDKITVYCNEESGFFEVYSDSESYEKRLEFAPEDFMALTEENCLIFSESILVPALNERFSIYLMQNM